MRDILSVIILTKNEEKNIIDCLETVEFADEILVIDDNSTDRTLELVSSLNNPKIKVITHDLNGDFSQQRNFALEKAKGDWVLFIDADERVSKKLQKSIVFYAHNTPLRGFYIQRRDILWNKKLMHGETGNIKLLRFVDKKFGSPKWSGKVHEVLEVKGETATIEGELLHYPHQTVQEFLSEINNYTTLRAEELVKRKTLVSSADIFLYPTGKFLVNYIVKRGFLDGVHGFIHATLMSFHSFLVRGKVYLLNSYEKK
jgi:glycosyltransferase involved in cell wall biosynthesis